MIQAEGTQFGCVCPDCLNRCRDCMGTNTVISRENLHLLAFRDLKETSEVEEEPLGAPTPEDWID